LDTLHGMLQPVWAATGRWVTALVLLVDGSGGQVTGGNAAQPAPHRGQPGSPWQSWNVGGGPPLGIPAPEVYAQTAESFSVGEQLLAFTDGVTEAGATRGLSWFQSGPLQAFLQGLPASSPGSVVLACLLQALQTHVVVDWPEDDTTALCLHWV